MLVGGARLDYTFVMKGKPHDHLQPSLYGEKMIQRLDRESRILSGILIMLGTCLLLALAYPLRAEELRGKVTCITDQHTVNVVEQSGPHSRLSDGQICSNQGGDLKRAAAPVWGHNWGYKPASQNL